MGDRDATFDRAAKPAAKQHDDDNTAVNDQLHRGALPGGAAVTTAAPPGGKPAHTLDHGLAAGKPALELVTLVRTTLFPAYRRAVDAIDPGAALELARHVVGSMKVIEDGKREVLATLPVADLHEWMIGMPGEPGLTEDQQIARVQELLPIKTSLIAGVPELENDLAMKIGPQMFRDQPVLGSFTTPAMGKDVIGYLASEAGAAVELISVFAQAHKIRAFVNEHRILEGPEATKILAKLPENPSKREIGQAANDLRTVVVDELMAQKNLARYPGARVLREVKVWEEQPDISVEDYDAMPPGKQGHTLRRDADGKGHVFKDMTDIDALIVAPGANGKQDILRMEQQKAGTTDTPADAEAQNDRALEEIEGALAGKKTILLEAGGQDITDKLNLGTAAKSDQVTVGPAGKGFNESLDVTATDLERLMKELVNEAKKRNGK